MHNRVLEAHENLKLLEKQSKILTKELQSFNKEKEEIEKKRTEALKMHTQIELDLRDVEERLASDIRSKVCFQLTFYYKKHKIFKFVVQIVFPIICSVLII